MRRNTALYFALYALSKLKCTTQIRTSSNGAQCTLCAASGTAYFALQSVHFAFGNFAVCTLHGGPGEWVNVVGGSGSAVLWASSFSR